MNDRVLIDTSVWIDFFRRRDVKLIEQIGILLKSGRAIYTGIIALELINGAKGQKELQALHDVFGAMEKINEMETTHFNAGKIGYEIARKGHTLGVVDLLIAQISIENDLVLMTFDEHFKVIAKYSNLKLLQQ
jgi:predicted nucleic acid-binding protein